MQFSIATKTFSTIDELAKSTDNTNQHRNGSNNNARLCDIDNRSLTTLHSHFAYRER